jgi:hypothetical protein
MTRWGTIGGMFVIFGPLAVVLSVVSFLPFDYPIYDSRALTLAQLRLGLPAALVILGATVILARQWSSEAPATS